MIGRYATDDATGDRSAEWGQRNGTLSDKTAAKEFGLTYAQIVAAIRAGRLQYRMGSMHGNPYLRLLRSEVESLVGKLHGAAGLKERQTKTELARIERDLRRLRSELAALEIRKAALLAEFAPRDAQTRSLAATTNTSAGVRTPRSVSGTKSARTTSWRS